MNTSRTIFSVISILIIARVFFTKGLEEAAALTVVILFISTMVWFTDFWTEYILPFGFWESKATDFKTPGNSSAALIFLAWVGLIIIGWAAL